MMDCCEFFATEEEASAANYADVDLERAKDLLDFGEDAPLPCLIVTD